MRLLWSEPAQSPLMGCWPNILRLGGRACASCVPLLCDIPGKQPRPGLHLLPLPHLRGTMTVVPICLQAASTGSNLKTAFGTSTNFSTGLEVILLGSEALPHVGIAGAGPGWPRALHIWPGPVEGVWRCCDVRRQVSLPPTGSPPEGCMWLWLVVGVQGIPCGD